MKRIGIACVLLGIIILAFGGFSYDRQRTLIDVGPIQATATEHHRLPVSPIVGGILLVGGMLMILVPNRRTA